MPYPQNYELASWVESMLRDEYGVEPATIALLLRRWEGGDEDPSGDGTSSESYIQPASLGAACMIGLTDPQLHDLAVAGVQGHAVKCSTRELSLFLASSTSTVAAATPAKWSPGISLNRWGATTVASTMHLAHQVSIPTFVTGGIGGVHRGAEVTMDVSTDLLELSRTPTVVVCGGIKSILDVRKTLEVLETNGVPVVTYRADEFPAFFSPRSGVTSPARVDSPMEVARAYWTARDLGLSHGLLVAVPNNDPAGEHVEVAIQGALREAHERNLHGPAVTPFVLRRVAETTSGESLRSNMALVENNARVGAEIAVAIAEISRERKETARKNIAHWSFGPEKSRQSPSSAPSGSRVVVVGGIVADVVAKPHGELILGTSNPASCFESDGGVGRNIAEVLGRLGDAPVLCSAVGDDSRGRAMLERLRRDCGVRVEDSVRILHHASTASYLAVMKDNGDLHVACADMEALAQVTAPSFRILRYAKAVVMDSNLPIPVLRETAERAAKIGIPVYLDPTSVPKAKRISEDETLLSLVTTAFPNFDELEAMAQCLIVDSESQTALMTLEELAVTVLSKLNPTGPAQLVVTLAEKGVFLAMRQLPVSALSSPIFQRFPADPNATVVNATGAGDTLCGAYIHAILQGKSTIDAIHEGISAASLSLASARTISCCLRP
jgi:pseudouridine-5'-phosphate glycosidase/sugar/nucleoside kinase (ribokinase family)